MFRNSQNKHNKPKHTDKIEKKREKERDNIE